MNTNMNKLGKRGRGYLAPKDRLKLVRRDWRYYRSFLQLIIENYEISELIGPILDVGCGAGHFIYLCRLFGLDVYGIEGEENLYKECVSKGFRVYQIDLELERKDIFPFESNFFSAILCNQVIEHLSFEGGLHILEEIYRVLKPGGLLLLFTPSKHNILERTKPNHLYCYSCTELKNLLLKASFVRLKNLSNPLRWFEFFSYNPDKDYSRCILQPNRLERMLNRIIWGVWKVMNKTHYLESGANFIAFKPGPNEVCRGYEE